MYRSYIEVSGDELGSKTVPQLIWQWLGCQQAATSEAQMEHCDVFRLHPENHDEDKAGLLEANPDLPGKIARLLQAS